MPFGCESYVDIISTAGSNLAGPSPMPFGCESYVDSGQSHAPSGASAVTNAFRL